MNRIFLPGLLILVILGACKTTPTSNLIKIDIAEALITQGDFVLSDLIKDVEIITLIRPGWTIDSHDMNCLRSREVKLPAIRDRLADLSEDRLGQANAAIIVMKLK